MDKFGLRRPKEASTQLLLGVCGQEQQVEYYPPNIHLLAEPHKKPIGKGEDSAVLAPLPQIRVWEGSFRAKRQQLDNQYIFIRRKQNHRKITWGQELAFNLSHSSNEL